MLSLLVLLTGFLDGAGAATNPSFERACNGFSGMISADWEDASDEIRVEMAAGLQKVVAECQRTVPSSLVDLEGLMAGMTPSTGALSEPACSIVSQFAQFYIANIFERLTDEFVQSVIKWLSSFGCADAVAELTPIMNERKNLSALKFVRTKLSSSANLEKLRELKFWLQPLVDENEADADEVSEQIDSEIEKLIEQKVETRRQFVDDQFDKINKSCDTFIERVQNSIHALDQSTTDANAVKRALGNVMKFFTDMKRKDGCSLSHFETVFGFVNTVIEKTEILEEEQKASGSTPIKWTGPILSLEIDLSRALFDLSNFFDFFINRSVSAGSAASGSIPCGQLTIQLTELTTGDLNRSEKVSTVQEMTALWHASSPCHSDPSFTDAVKSAFSTLLDILKEAKDCQETLVDYERSNMSGRDMYDAADYMVRECGDFDILVEEYSGHISKYHASNPSEFVSYALNLYCADGMLDERVHEFQGANFSEDPVKAVERIREIEAETNQCKSVKVVDDFGVSQDMNKTQDWRSFVKSFRKAELDVLTKFADLSVPTDRTAKQAFDKAFKSCNSIISERHKSITDDINQFQKLERGARSEELIFAIFSLSDLIADDYYSDFVQIATKSYWKGQKRTYVDISKMESLREKLALKWSKDNSSKEIDELKKKIDNLSKEIKTITKKDQIEEFEKKMDYAAHAFTSFQFCLKLSDKKIDKFEQLLEPIETLRSKITEMKDQLATNQSSKSKPGKVGSHTGSTSSKQQLDALVQEIEGLTGDDDLSKFDELEKNIRSLMTKLQLKGKDCKEIDEIIDNKKREIEQSQSQPSFDDYIEELNSLDVNDEDAPKTLKRIRKKVNELDLSDEEQEEIKNLIADKRQAIDQLTKTPPPPPQPQAITTNDKVEPWHVSTVIMIVVFSITLVALLFWMKSLNSAG